MNRMKLSAYNLLKKSESFFKTDMIYVAKGSFWLTLGQVVSVLLAFISSLFFANVIPKEVFGNYKFIIATASILGSLSLTGMGPVVVQAVIRGAEGVFKDAVHTTLRWGVIMLAGAAFGATYYFVNGNTTLGFSFLIIGGATLLMNSYGLYGYYLVGKKDFRRNTLYSVISQVCVTGAVIITAVTTKNVLAIVAAYFLLNAAFIIIFYRLIVRSNRINNIRDSSLISYSKHLSLMNFFGALASQADKILLFHYLGATQLAIYVFSQAIPEQFRGLFKSLFGITLPKYASLSQEEMRHSIKKKLGQLTVIAALMIIAYIFVAPYIFKLFFPKYLGAVFYSQIYVLGLITIPGISLFATYFQLKGDVGLMYKLSIASNAVTLIVTFLLVYKYGLLGAVIANGLSWLIMLITHWFYFVRDRSSREKVLV